MLTVPFPLLLPSAPLPPPPFPFPAAPPPPLSLLNLSLSSPSFPLPPSPLSCNPNTDRAGEGGGNRKNPEGLSPAFVCSVPDESSASEDRSAASSPEDRDPGLFLLRKDSERRAILYKILWEEQNQVASNLQECVAQVQLGMGARTPTRGQVPQQVQMGRVFLPPWDICTVEIITTSVSQHPSLFQQNKRKYEEKKKKKNSTETGICGTLR